GGMENLKAVGRVAPLTASSCAGSVNASRARRGSAGKSTTMRVILGLDAPTSGSVLVNGEPYRQYTAPLREVGALLEARSVHPGRSAYNHLLALARTSRIHRSRVDEVIEAVGLAGAPRRRARKAWLGRARRLGTAAAL